MIRLAVFLILMSAAGFSQVGSTGEVRGVVTDPSSAVIPGATLVAKDVATGITQRTTSGGDGAFVFLSLLPGKYDITVTAAGFQTSLVSGIVVETGRSLDLPVKLNVGQTTETVEVKDVAQVLQTSTNQIATTVRNDHIQDLPFSGRDVLAFARLSAGVSQPNGPTTFNGLPTAALNVSLDGINVNDTRNRSGAEGFSSLAPLRLDAIEELTVTTSGTAADAASGGAMTIRFTTKRGTQQYHGRVFEQFRNDALNAGAFFDNMRGIRKTKVRVNDFGGNLGGPLKLPFLPKNKLFFFVNYEDAPRPGSINPTATTLTSEAQSGVYRYVGTDNLQHTVNVLQLAASSGYQSSIDPIVANVLKGINETLSRGVLTPSTSNLYQQTLQWRQDRGSRDIYPTARLDYQITDSLAWHGVWNLQHNHTDGSAPAYPGLALNSAESKFTRYALSNGVDWSIRPSMLNSFKLGVQSSVSINNLRNSIDQWAPQNYKRITFGSGIGNFIPNSTPLVRTNPAYTLSDELSWVKGKHTYKFGGSLLYTRFFESDYYQQSGVLTYTLGISGADPINSVFTAGNLPFIRTQDIGAGSQLYASLTGRVSNIRGFRNIDENARQYIPYKPLVYRESYTSWGLYFQDSYRMTPRLTLNYGLRWEFTGFMNNTNNTFMSPTYFDVLAPSVANFQPGVLLNRVPAIDQRSQTYAPDKINPAPNFGFAWNPRFDNGVLSKLFGSGGKTVIRGSYSINYFDEGLNVDYWVNTNAGNWQSVQSQPGFPGFAPGGLTLQSPDPPFVVSPPAFTPPFPETLFAFGGYNIGTNAGMIRGENELPIMRNPYVQNWTFGIQREILKDTVLEVRYVGNKTTHKWHLYGVQETNIFENGFLKEFINAQNNLAINTAAGVSSFQNRGLPGQVALPIYETAFGARGSQPALSAAQGFTSNTFLSQLRLGQAGSAATSLAGGSSSVYFCRLVGNRFSPCADLGFDAAGPFPINFFRPNPYADDLTVTDDNSFYTYNALQVELRRQYRNGLTLTGNYTWSHGLGDLFVVSNNLAGGGNSNYYMTLRNRALDKSPSPFDVRHTFQTYWNYDLPFGNGRRFSVSNGALDRIVGGWAISGIYRLTSGRIAKMTSGQRTVNTWGEPGVILNGLTLDQLSEKLKTFSDGPNFTLYSADRSLIDSAGRANSQYLALPTTPGQFGQILYMYGPKFFSADMALHKEIRIFERMRFNFQAEFLNFLNHPVFSATNYNINSTTFGQTTSTAVGPRNIQLRAYLSW
jgi:hypothetical protein